MGIIENERIAHMQQYLKMVTESGYNITPEQKTTAMAELFNYYHSDWGKDAAYFIEKDLELFDDVKMQNLFHNYNPSKKAPRTIIREEEKSKYKRPMRPGEE